MEAGFDIGQILRQYGGADPHQAAGRAEEDFDRVAQASPHDDLADGLAESFRSDLTPPFGSMVANLFALADEGQRAGMLNQLMAALGPAAAAALDSGGAGGLLGGTAVSGQLHPSQVESLARQAERANPGIVAQMARFFAQHPNLVKGLGGAALVVAMRRMAQQRGG